MYSGLAPGASPKAVIDALDAAMSGALRTRIVSDAGERRWLESLLHPLIGAEIRQHLQRATSPYAILVSPLLIESGQYRMTQRVLVIDTPEEEQIRRTMQRDQVAEDQVKAILQVQAAREKRLQHAHDVLVNDRDLHWLQQQVERLHQQYLRFTGGQP